jgi:hypothetical protein
MENIMENNTKDDQRWNEICDATNRVFTIITGKNINHVKESYYGHLPLALMGAAAVIFVNGERIFYKNDINIVRCALIELRDTGVVCQSDN